MPVCDSVHMEGVSVPWGPLGVGRVGVSVQEGLCPVGVRIPLYSKERAVCILLECFLVYVETLQLEFFKNSPQYKNGNIANFVLVVSLGIN